MERENDRSKEVKVPQRKPYIKPQITSVNLIAEEAVLNVCKTVGCELLPEPINIAGS